MAGGDGDDSFVEGGGVGDVLLDVVQGAGAVWGDVGLRGGPV